MEKGSLLASLFHNFSLLSQHLTVCSCKQIVSYTGLVYIWIALDKPFFFHISTCTAPRNRDSRQKKTLEAPRWGVDVEDLSQGNDQRDQSSPSTPTRRSRITSTSETTPLRSSMVNGGTAPSSKAA